MLTLFFVLLGSCAVALLVTPLAGALAARCRLVDRPDGRRKIHARPIPLAGGLAVFLSAGVALGAVFSIPQPLSPLLAEQGASLLGLFFAALVIIIVGVADDYGLMRGRHKLVGQLVAVLIVTQFGLVVREVRLFNWIFELGPLAVPFTCLWLLGAINALNLLDGMDGLLGSVGLILCAALAAWAALQGHVAVACVALALAGALLGFLRYNLPPARIFLGDAGSMLIGLVIGTLAIKASLKGPATAAMAAPVALLTIPFLDTAAAIVRRKLTGRSIYTTDRGHLHHCLLGHGFSNRYVLMLVGLCCLLTVSGALVSVALEQELIALVTAATVIGMLIVTQLFGHAEYLLIRKRLGGLARALLHRSVKGEPRQTEVRLQGTLDWAELWNNLLARSPWLHIKLLRLNVNAPSLHEGYHASWECGHEEGEDNRLWRAEIPLMVNGLILGRLELAGQSVDDEPAWKKIACVMELVEDFEAAASDMIAAPKKRVAPKPLLGLAREMKNGQPAKV
jgi:UDP-GlcNAc:undecaprenyl-phosphate/decaprenyl-phosphate GlcNAc-1-phosphate transferase